MDKFVIGLGATIAASLIAALTVCGLTLVTPLVGALSGWIVGWAFPVTTSTFLSAVGLGALQVWQAGAMFAWVGGFMRFTAMKKG